MNAPARTKRTTPLMRHLFQLAVSSLLLLVTSPALAQQQLLLVVGEGTSAAAFGFQVGRVLTFICPAKLNPTGEIWGTDVYLYQSPICTAAVHAGALTQGTSGLVTIVMGPGVTSFEGIGRNGVTSSSYGPGVSTYSFIKNGEPGHIDWITTLDRVPDDFHSPLTLLCPPKGHADAYVWGTDVYTASSAICVAAVHAGAITLETGGKVTVTLQPKQETFIGSDRNKISSRHWTNWDFQSYEQPYRLSAVAADSSGSGRRTIRLPGFTASGTAVPIVPRKIQLSGFTATGTATPIVPRTIRVPGWTGTGNLPTP